MLLYTAEVSLQAAGGSVPGFTGGGGRAAGCPIDAYWVLHFILLILGDSPTPTLSLF